MNIVLAVIPCYSEDGTVISLTVSSPSGAPITDSELANFLEDYAALLRIEAEPEMAN